MRLEAADRAEVRVGQVEDEVQAAVVEEVDGGLALEVEEVERTRLLHRPTANKIHLTKLDPHPIQRWLKRAIVQGFGQGSVLVESQLESLPRFFQINSNKVEMDMVTTTMNLYDGGQWVWADWEVGEMLDQDLEREREPR